MSNPAIASQSWTLWMGGIIVFSAMCILMGFKARPIVVAMCCVATGIVLIASSPLPFRSSLALVSVPMTGGFLCSGFRYGHLQPFQFLGGSLAPLLGIIGLYEASWIPSAVFAGLAFVVMRTAKHLSRRALFILSVLPTVGALLFLMSPSSLA
jgi:hypothetical protein